MNDYYKATEAVIEALESAYCLEDDKLVFEGKHLEEKKYGIIFYPGGKVEYTAYAPLMKSCAEEGITCVILHMPANLAVLDVNAADGIQKQFPEIDEWYMAGHSLGGSMAASYVEKHREEFAGLILLASYSTENLVDSDLKVMSVYGSEDRILNREKYEEYKSNLPADYIENIISGGCHAYFGNYGEQEGDGTAQITIDEQQKITVEAIVDFIR